MKKRTLIVALGAALILLIILLFCTFLGITYWQEQSLPVYSENQTFSEQGTPIHTLTSGNMVYINGPTESFLEPIDGRWTNQMGKTPGGQKIYGPPGQSYPEYVVLKGFMFPETVYRNNSSSTVELRALRVSEIRFSANQGLAPLLKKTQDPRIIDEVLRALRNPQPVKPTQAQSQTYHIDLVSEQIPGLGYFVYVWVDENRRVFFADRFAPDNWMPAGEHFTQWAIDK